MPGEGKTHKRKKQRTENNRNTINILADLPALSTLGRRRTQIFQRGQGGENKISLDIKKGFIYLPNMYFNQTGHRRPEQDFGLETETRVVSVLVSSLETTYSKSQYQSQFLRPK